MQNPILLRLFDHNLHATQTLLVLCADLSAEEYERQFAIGLGSLRQTLEHVIGCMLRWADRIADRPLRPSVEAEDTHKQDIRTRSFLELHRLLLEADLDLRAIAVELEGCGRLEETMNFIDEGINATYRFTRATALVHLMTHGVHHRAQALNMLRQLGLASDKIPDLDAIDSEIEMNAKD